MRKRLHLIVTLLFVVVTVFNLVVWGAAPGLPDVGVAIERSAGNEAPLASTYIALGSYLVGWVPTLDRVGAALLTTAVGETFPRLAEDPSVAMDLILSERYNRTHGWLKFFYWAAPALLVLTILLWVRKPKKVSLIGGR